MHRWPLRIAFACLVVALLLLAGIAFATFRDNTWKPLGPYPEQTIKTTDTVQWSGDSYASATITIPAVRLPAPVKVEGTKCVRADDPVTINGTKGWASVDPRGFILADGSGVRTAQPGCRTSVFENAVPAGVQQWAEEQFTKGKPFVVVQMGGCETPVSADGKSGQQLCWATESFALLPKG